MANVSVVLHHSPPGENLFWCYEHHLWCGCLRRLCEFTSTCCQIQMFMSCRQCVCCMLSNWRVFLASARQCRFHLEVLWPFHATLQSRLQRFHWFPPHTILMFTFSVKKAWSYIVKCTFNVWQTYSYNVIVVVLLIRHPMVKSGHWYFRIYVTTSWLFS